MLFILSFNLQSIFAQDTLHNEYRLIAHRGGVVDENTPENSRGSILKAIQHKYWMVELDLRLTKDGELIIHHDKHFTRYYGVDSLVAAMNWSSIKNLTSPTGAKVLRFEDALKLCEGKINVMIDNKIDGNDTLVFAKVIDLLKKHKLLENALMIGTDESTEYFTGKIKLSCTRKQLEDNMQRPHYKSSDYYLFSRTITKEDAEWAKDNRILAVGVLNRWALGNADKQEIRRASDQLKSTGIQYFQIDSEFEHLFK